MLTCRGMLWLLTAAGVGLRALLLVTAEHQLDSDEATVAVMALDIFEGRAFPFFLYHASYNGGAALEGYFAAAGFALFGVSAHVVKLTVLGLWTATAVLFAELCRRTLEGIAPFLAVLVMSVGTPFVLEWSLKARGGYEETLLLGVWLLWLGVPPPGLRARPRSTAFLFGASVGAGAWISEMILPLVPGALIWLVTRREPAERRHLILPLLLGAGVGLAPLLAYNITHDWSNAARSVLVRLFMPSGRPPLSPAQLLDSAEFVLGPAWWLALAAVAIAAIKLLRTRDRLNLAHICLLSVTIYSFGYWVAGLRYLAVPPSRVLFPLFPYVAVLLATAVGTPSGWRTLRGAIVAAAIATWIAATAVPTVRWAASGEPRESGSWRGSWALIDAAGLYHELARLRVSTAYASYWTAWPLRFEARRARRSDPSLPPLQVRIALPESARAAARVAFVVHEGAPDRLQIETQLARQGVAHSRSSWGPFALFTEVDSVHVAAGRGFPDKLLGGSIPTPRGARGSFN